MKRLFGKANVWCTRPFMIGRSLMRVVARLFFFFSLNQRKISTALATATGGLGLRLLLVYLVIRLQLVESLLLHVAQHGQRIFHGVINYILDLQLVLVVRVRVGQRAELLR